MKTIQLTQTQIDLLTYSLRCNLENMCDYLANVERLERTFEAAQAATQQIKADMQTCAELCRVLLH